MKMLKSFRDHDPRVSVSENRLNPEKPNGFADHYPVFKWRFHWEYTLFSDKPTCFSKNVGSMGILFWDTVGP